MIWDHSSFCIADFFGHCGDSDEPIHLCDRLLSEMSFKSKVWVAMRVMNLNMIG